MEQSRSRRKLLTSIKYILCAFLWICISCHKNKVSYPLPENISRQNKKLMTEYFNRGRDLYKINCAKCHGIYSKGNDQSPDFTQFQLDTYKSKANMQGTETHLFAEKISYNDLEAILHFLTYKKVKK